MKTLFLTITGILTCASAVLAGDVSGKGPNGGRIADSTNMHIELVSKDNAVFVYAYDHANKPVSTSGMVGRVTIQEKGKLRTLDLQATPPNGLTGSLDAPLVTGARLVVSITPRTGKPEQARYTAN